MKSETREWSARVPFARQEAPENSVSLLAAETDVTVPNEAPPKPNKIPAKKLGAIPTLTASPALVYAIISGFIFNNLGRR